MTARGPVIAFALGALFSVGLAVGGMTSPDNILAFLDVTGDWNPRLMFVMAGALGTYALMTRWMKRRAMKPVFATEFEEPVDRDVDGRLVVGATLFGIGWGVSGYCPGPVFAALGTFTWAPAVMAASMFVGMAVHARLFGPSPDAKRADESGG